MSKVGKQIFAAVAELNPELCKEDFCRGHCKFGIDGHLLFPMIHPVTIHLQ